MKDVNTRKAFICRDEVEDFAYLHSCGYKAVDKADIDNHLNSCEKFPRHIPKPTFTTAQLNDIIEEIAVKVETLNLSVIREYTDTKRKPAGAELTRNIAAKIIREAKR